MQASRPRYGFGTQAVHAGQTPDPATGAIMPPIYQTSTYVQRAPGDHQGYEYARVSNPTRTALEGNLAALEGARHGIAFASGVAATDAVVRCLRPGDHLVASEDLYGGTYRLFRQVFEPFGIHATFVDMTDLDAVEQALTPATKLLWIETPTNPLLRILDIRALSELAHAHGIDVAVDNTFATPYLQQPLSLGADLVVHSTTKYLGGHSDLIGGAVCTSRDDWAERLRFLVKTVGAVPGPMDCFLTLRGTKTLHLRMERHAENARRVAEFLAGHPKVGRVYYPGLPGDPGHALARRQMRAFGGMVSFVLKDESLEKAVRVLSGTHVFALAESLGGVESLINHPATMTHASIPREDRLRAGLSDALIRLSVGIEEVDDLLADLDQALAAV
ncbi:cystathionine gamma-synthase [Rhodocaloribacter litoris]|uniref:cystathionine gamma-synthase n=1 Tax=Rhodocaloribacter litoris TaxID=2558931 RepID=UPI00141FF378|nr:cystathionine gamma-synthase [Rhodocaloribacter litoris]QXD14275.1 cystathionine gamma-synthase [Rhodocaloribacter litoris]